ncbi:MAG: adenylate kinase [Saprospiraceae bacterium]|jgi:adenylate kinase|nr:adenylate kinase [Saprospiraceae bacterium]
MSIHFGNPGDLRAEADWPPKLNPERCAIFAPQFENMMHLILFGPPGSGKGTQADKLVSRYGLAHISTGDLFRSEIRQKTEFGNKAMEYISRGELVPDALTIEMLRARVAALSDVRGFIYDGFPRTLAQAKALDEMLAVKGDAIHLLLALDVPEDEIVRRILHRGLSSGRPDDTDEAIIRNRITVYHQETSVLFDHYAVHGVAHRVNGLGSIDEIFDRLCRHLDPLF